MDGCQLALYMDIKHSVEMSVESNDCVYSLGAKRLVIIDSRALGG